MTKLKCNDRTWYPGLRHAKNVLNNIIVFFNAENKPHSFKAKYKCLGHYTRTKLKRTVAFR